MLFLFFNMYVKIKDIKIKNLISPYYLYEEKDQIKGSIEKKITGISISDYLRFRIRNND